MTPNPFTMLYDKIWEMIEVNPNIDKLVSSKNKIKYDDWTGVKDNIADADFPELALLSESAITNLMQTSNTTNMIKQYSWVITTGDFRINEVYNQLTWELFRAMMGWDHYLTALVWEDQHFVKRVNMVALNEGTFRMAQNRGIRGWSSIWSFEIECHFVTRTLRVP